MVPRPYRENSEKFSKKIFNLGIAIEKMLKNMVRKILIVKC